jgi:hypothetical protein
VLVLAAVAYVAYGRGYPNSDAMWTLVWGQEVWEGGPPSYEAGPTPHPLTTLLGIALAPFGSDGEGLLHAAGYVAVGLAIVAAGLGGAALFSGGAGAVAAVLLATRDAMLFNGALAYLDVLFCALVLLAFLAAVRDRGDAWVLGILAASGLVRPEGWIIAGAYWFLRVREPGLAGRTVLVLAAPVVWLAGDLVVTGDPLFSFTTTREATPGTGQPSGLDGAVGEGWRVLAQGARPATGVLAAIGLALHWHLPRARFLLGAIVVTFVAALLPVVAGTPLNERYLLPTIALLCIAAAGSVLGLRQPGPAWRRAAGVASVVLLAAASALQVDRLRDRRTIVTGLVERRADARAVLLPGTPCAPLVVPGARLTPFAAVWADRPLGDIVDGARAVPPDGSYVWGSREAMAGIITIPGRPGGAGAEPEAPVVRAEGDWRLRARCP